MLTKSQQLLLETIKASLFDLLPHYPSEIDWDAIVAEANAQTVLGLISPVLPMPVEFGVQVKAMYMRIMYEQDMLIKCFDAAQIPCVILKGSAAAVYYPKPYLRTMGDIDVLVPRERFIESLKVLELDGYIYDHGKGENEHFPNNIREMAYVKNGIIVEIHQTFSSPGVDVDSILEGAIDRREYFVLNGYRFPVLPCPENGLVLLGHINQHLKNNVLGMRQIIDWMMYLHSVTDKASWYIQFEPLLEKTGLQTLAAYVTRMCSRHLGLPDEVVFGIDVDDELVDELLEVIITDGNFGRRVDPNITVDDKLMRVSYGIKKWGGFGYFIQVGLETSSFCRKHPTNRFFAFFYGFFRQVSKGGRVFHKHKNLKKSLDKGKNIYEMHTKRCDLYRKLGVRDGKE